MTFSFTLVLGLFLLAPGFAAFAGLYHGSRLGTVDSPAPQPGSILALSIVTVGALAAHLLGAVAFFVQDVACARLRCLRVDYDPNVYRALASMAAPGGGAHGPIPGLEVVAVFGTLAALTVAAFALARPVVVAFVGRERLQRLLYGWLADLALAQARDEAVLAYALSDVQADGTVLGYEGLVDSMTTTADKEITSLLLVECETFYLRITPGGVFRRKTARGAPIPQLYLDRSRLKNAAFERVKFAA